MTADQDDDALGGTRTLTHTVTNYPGVTSAANVTVTVSDDDTAGVTISPATPLTVTEGGEETYTVVLNTRPAGTVTVAIDEGIGATAPITIDPVSLMLTFVPAEWNAVQTVTVTADQDDDALGGTRTLTHTVTNYPGVTSAANVTVTVSDDDTAGVTISPATPLTVTEGGEETYTVVLNTRPAGTVTVAIDEGIGATAPITIDPVSLMLTFVPAEWNAVQTVTVTADQDDDALGGTRTLTHTVTNYPGVTSAANVTVTVSDDDTAGVTISPATPLTVTEGGEETYTVVLNTRPAGTVTVAIDEGIGATAPITIDPVSLMLTFVPAEWNAVQTVTVTADQDDDALGGTRTLTHTVTNYPGVTSAANVTVTVSDDDTAGVTISPATPLTVTEGGEETYTVVLNTRPAGTVTVAIDEGIGATAPITIDPVSLMLTFVPAEWNAVQTVTVTADQDDDALGGTRTLTHTVTNYPRTVTPVANVTVTVSDDDTAGVTISPATPLTVTEGGEETYTVVLNTDRPGP